MTAAGLALWRATRASLGLFERYVLKRLCGSVVVSFRRLRETRWLDATGFAPKSRGSPVNRDSHESSLEVAALCFYWEL